MLDELDDHFIVCGYGRMGEIIAREFARQKVPFVVIERNPERMQVAIEARLPRGRGGRETRKCCKRVGIDARPRLHRRGQHRRRERLRGAERPAARPDLFIIGRAETEDARRKLMRAGADRVISPYQIGGLQLAQTALRPAVVDFVQLATSSDNLDLNMEQVARSADGSPLAGRACSRPGCASASACRRRRSSAPTAAWNSTRRRRP